MKKLFALILGIASIAIADPFDGDGDGGVSEFYRWMGPGPAAPGNLLRREPFEQKLMLENGATQERILYSSTDGARGAGIAVVSGGIYFPKGAPPSGGWPILAWAHGTTGIADVCAPSWRGWLKRDRAYLNAWLSEGFVVVASDYQGLGTPGIHPYMLSRPEAYGILDGVRAVLHFYPSAKNAVVIVGQSQGSGAALGASYFAPTYAPDINVLGTVATGLVVQLASPVPGAPQIPIPPYAGGGAVDAAYSMLYLLGMDRALDPSLKVSEFVSEEGKPLLQAALTSCLGDSIRVAKDRHLAPDNAFTSKRNALLASEEQNDAFPGARFQAPVFTGTGLADAEAGTAPQYNFISDLCTAGSTVQWHYYPGLTHNGTVNASLKDSVPFVRDLLANRRITGNCPSLVAPGPLQEPLPGIPFNN